MGLLDEAIREHLELKRLRGADPSEIARAEREALGPVRRAVDPAEESGPEVDRELAPPLDDHPAEIGAGRVAGDVADPDQPGELAADGPTAAPDELALPSAGGARGRVLEEGDEWLAHDPPPSQPDPAHHDVEPAPELDEHATQVYPAPTDQPVAPPPPAPAPRVAESERLDPEQGAGPRADPAEVRPSAPAPAGAEPPHEAPEVIPDGEEGEDVLEETPDFLQETPEHDRLWFEQRPPRDFDFDK